MAKRKKHRLVIEVTTSSAITEADAVRGLQLVLDSRLDLERGPIWAYDRSPYVDKLTVKAWSRVIRAGQGFLA
jgi:hypothetical protein